MSVAPELETVSCPREGCEWTFTGEANDCRYKRRAHETFHEEEDERLAPKAPEPEDKPTRTIGSELPRVGARDMAAEERTAYLSLPLTVRCADCLWETNAPAAQARREWAEHRRDEHEDDSGMASVERMEAGGRRTTGGRVPIRLVNEKQLQENVARVRLQGGTGPGVVRAERASEPAASDEAEKEEPVMPPQAKRPKGWWTRERVIEAFQAFHAEHGRWPRQKELRLPLPAGVVVTRHFGSLGGAIAALSTGDAQAAPPPTPMPAGQAGGQNPTPIAAKPAPAAASEGTQNGTLTSLAARVEELTERRRELLAGLDDVDLERAQTVDKLREALSGHVLDEEAV